LHSDSDNKDFSYQLTFFRAGLAPNGESIYLAHFAITDVKNKQFYYFELSNRNILQKAGVKQSKTSSTRIWNQNWSCVIKPPGDYNPKHEEHQLKAFYDLQGQDNKKQTFAIDLKLFPTSSPVIQGEKNKGVSIKGSCPSCASHYFSYPVMETGGKIIIGGQEFKVTGKSWMDHEFGSSQLEAKQVGWDWFSIQFEDNSSLMLYRIREQNGGESSFSSGKYVSASGQSYFLNKKDFYLRPKKYWKSPKSGTRYPLAWDVTVPAFDLGLRVLPTIPNQELLTNLSTQVNYWEGSIKAIDRRSGRPVGKGYLELTGYDGKLASKFKSQ
jgi:predicted secreted hydrolase